MPSFAFSPEQEDFRVQLRKFAVAELAPHYIERAARPGFCWDAHRQLAERGDGELAQLDAEVFLLRAEGE